MYSVYIFTTGKQALNTGCKSALVLVLQPVLGNQN